MGEKEETPVKPTITVTIDSHGQTQVAVANVKGTSCRDVTKALENALGSVRETDPTADYFRLPDLKVTA